PYLARYYERLLRINANPKDRFRIGFESVYGVRSPISELVSQKTAYCSLETLHGRPTDLREMLLEAERNTDTGISELYQFHKNSSAQRTVLDGLRSPDAEIFDSSLK